MNDEDIRQRTRTHFLAFVAVLALAMMAAGTALADKANVSAVLAIAAVQVLIVLAAMMHAHREGPWVKWLVAFCVLNVAGLAGALCVGYFDTINGTKHIVSVPAEPNPGPQAEDGGADH